MASVRGKFVVSQVTRTHWNKDTAEITLTAQYSPNNPEDQSYAAATPTATILMSVTNPAAVATLELGKAFYVDFTPLDE